MKKQLLAAAALAVALLPFQPAVADERPYTEGSVWDMTMVRTTEGLGDDYLESLGKNYKPILDEAKKQGLILSWRIISVPPANADDFDLVLLVEYKNWAAFDGLSDKMEAIARKVISRKDERDLMVKRLEVRRILGNKTGQELHLK